MYLRFHKLREFPFSMGSDEKYFYESCVHAEALANMLYTFRQRKGMALVSGEVGAGKTFMGQLLIHRLGNSCQTVILKDPPQSGKQLLRGISRGLGIQIPPSADKMQLATETRDYLLRMFRRGRLVALIIDECQDLCENALEEIRLLWNWEQDGQRLIQILLIGQPELREQLLEPKWESLRQRIVLSYHLRSLTLVDTANYIRHRLKVASENGENGNGHVEFTPKAIAEIFNATNGIPRMINVVCDNALLVSFTRGVNRVDQFIIMDVLRDMTCWWMHHTGTQEMQYSSV